MDVKGILVSCPDEIEHSNDNKKGKKWIEQNSETK